MNTVYAVYIIVLVLWPIVALLQEVLGALWWRREHGVPPFSWTLEP